MNTGSSANVSHADIYYQSNTSSLAQTDFSSTSHRRERVYSMKRDRYSRFCKKDSKGLSSPLPLTRTARRRKDAVDKKIQEWLIYLEEQKVEEEVDQLFLDSSGSDISF